MAWVQSFLEQSLPQPPSSKNATNKQHVIEKEQPLGQHSVHFPSPHYPTKGIVARIEEKTSLPTPPLTPSTDCSINSASTLSPTYTALSTPISPLTGHVEESSSSVSFRRSSSCGTQQSEIDQHINITRRSIFGNNVWKQTRDGEYPRSRINGWQSPCSPPLCPTSAITYRQIQKLVRPPVGRCLNRPHFRAVEDQNPNEKHNATTQTMLPQDLPYPMRRFYHNGPRRTQLGGVYPMISPTSILRNSSFGQTSPTTTAPSPRSDQLKQQYSSSSLSSSASASDELTKVDVPSLNMIDKARRSADKQGRRKQQLQDQYETSSTSSTSERSIGDTEPQQGQEQGLLDSTCTSLSLGEDGEGEVKQEEIKQQQPKSHQPSRQCCPSKKVRFDPRVTITEFEDNSPRYWFSAFELERLQKESVHLVQRYLIANPSMIVKYNQPRLDPVTGTYRKPALFSIPILNANSPEEEEKLLSAAGGSTKNRRCCATEFMARKQVQHILIAARNHFVSDLLSRSLQTIFPHATIITVTTGEEALRVFSDQACRCGGFDVVVADGPLNRSLSRSPATVSLDRIDRKISKDMTGPQSERAIPSLPRPCVSLSDLGNMASSSSLPSSRSDYPPPPSSGAELFRCIVEITNTKTAVSWAVGNRGDTANRDDAKSVTGSSASKVPLLIGLTTSSPRDQEGKAMTENGAGMVWALPPPRMDECLRDEIVSKLLQKRRCHG